MSTKLALQADLWYNEDLIWLWSEMVEHLRPRYKIGACTMSNTIPSTSGIYKIICTITGKFYIGSAIDLRHRSYEHFSALRQNNHDNPKLQHAYNKYGPDAFTFEVLELILPMSLTAREQYWFHKLQPFGKRGFNIAREAGSQLGAKHTPETRAKMRLSHKGKGFPLEARKNSNARIGHPVSPETREKLRQANLGKKHTPESSEKKRQAMLGNKHSLGYKHTPETREKMRQRSGR